eukprot:TRINITY_DN28773_c0_g1_i1.p3 TRINITY_DN28773_c0_g1~~TRINITY_DN28773_c0_g1_i1.p3  ORF type:complete len:104 (+),score=9.04 TRINITY_DN28773_c0_g1_i1:240-551(+)
MDPTPRKECNHISASLEPQLELQSEPQSDLVGAAVGGGVGGVGDTVGWCVGISDKESRHSHVKYFNELKHPSHQFPLVGLHLLDAGPHVFGFEVYQEIRSPHW